MGAVDRAALRSRSRCWSAVPPVRWRRVRSNCSDRPTDPGSSWSGRSGQQRLGRAGRRRAAVGEGGAGDRSSTRSRHPEVLPSCGPGDRRRVRHRVPRQLLVPGHRRCAGAGGRHPLGCVGARRRRRGRPAHPLATVTFAALKPGLLLAAGPAYCGRVELADIGLDVSSASIHLVTDADVVAWVPERAADDHKWRHAVWLVAGSPEMPGRRAWLRRCPEGRRRVPAALHARRGRTGPPTEAVSHPVDVDGWAEQVLAGAPPSRRTRHRARPR